MFSLRSLFLLLAFCVSFNAWTKESAYQRVVSMNLCADQILMSLLPPDRLVGITSLASDPQASYLYEKASNFHQHNGRIEEVMALEPDLVVVGQFTATATTQLLRRLGYPVLEIGLPHSFDDIFQQLSLFSSLTDIKPLEKQLRNRLKQTQNKLKHPAPKAVIYYANGYSAGKQTMAHAILNTSGAINVAAEQGMQHISQLSLEHLISAQPHYVLVGRLDKNTDSLAHEVLRHPALKKLASTQQAQRIEVPDRLWSCAGPSSVTAVEYLQQHMTGSL